MSKELTPPEHEGFELVATGTGQEMKEGNFDFTHWDIAGEFNGQEFVFKDSDPMSNDDTRKPFF